MSDVVDSDEREITEEDAVVQTASGERYRIAELNKTGERTREN